MAGTEIQGAIILGRNAYNALPYQGTLLMWAVVLVAFGVNTIGGKFLPRLETLILVIHILGYFGVLIPMTYMADHKSTREVFTEFTNGGNLYTDGLSFFVGMTGCVFAFAGGDAAVHVSRRPASTPTLRLTVDRWPKRSTTPQWSFPGPFSSVSPSTVP